MTTRRIVLLGFLGALALAGCQKDSETAAPSSPSKTSLLTADPWRLTSYTRTTGSRPPESWPTDFFPASCRYDDRYTFKANGVVEQNEYAQACRNSQPNTIVGTMPWSFNADQTQLTIGSVPYEVVQLTADVMQLRWTRSQNGQSVVDNARYEN